MRVPLTLACGAYDRTAGLADGELDALYTPRVPRGRVRRLFADSRAEEERYFAATGIFRGGAARPRRVRST